MSDFDKAQIDAQLDSERGVHQICNISDAAWRYIKRRVRAGTAEVVEDYSFPRVTKRYFSVTP